MHGSESKIRTALGKLFYIPAYKGKDDIEIVEDDEEDYNIDLSYPLKKKVTPKKPSLEDDMEIV